MNIFNKMTEISDTVYGFDLRNCYFFVDLKEPTSKTLLEQINDRYSELVDLNGSFSYALSYKSSQLIRDQIETHNKTKLEGSNVIDESDIKIETKDSISPRKSGNILFSLK